MPNGGKGYMLHIEQYEAPGFAPFKQEFNTLTCCHCNTVVVLNPARTRERHWCFKCDHYVCDKKVCITECNPILQSVDLAQANDGDDAYLLRGPNGEVLFDIRKRDNTKPYGGISLKGDD